MPGRDPASRVIEETEGERKMGATTIEVAAGHLAMVSHPQETADLITRAVRSTGGSATTD